MYQTPIKSFNFKYLYDFIVGAAGRGLWISLVWLKWLYEMQTLPHIGEIVSDINALFVF